MMHEVGHSLEAGESDDNPGNLPFSEVYSGSGADSTPEVIVIKNSARSGRSIMRRGYAERTQITYQETTYFTYSVEELLSIEEYGQE